MRLNRNISGALEKPQPEPLIGTVLVKKLSQEVVMPCFRRVKGNVREDEHQEPAEQKQL